MNIPSPRPHKRARIEIIPLIDVIFFLLATFMIVSLSMARYRGIPVNLPVATTAVAPDRQPDAVISIARAGSVFFNKEPLRLDQLPARLAQLKAAQPDPRVWLSGDDKAYYGAAVAVLDELRQAGIAKVAIDTKPKS
jgi:biopolymer transport protein ExbD